WLMVQQIAHQGIGRIAGDCIIDDSYFDSSVYAPGYDEDNSSRAYEAATSALAVNFNCVAVHQAPGDTIGSPAHIALFPKSDALIVRGHAQTVLHGCAMNISTGAQGDKTVVNVGGCIRLSDEPKYQYRKVWDIRQFFAGALASMLRENGIVLQGAVRYGKLPEKNAKLLLEFSSLPMSEYVGEMFKYSNNFTAEMFFKMLGANRLGAPGTWDKGATVMKGFWKAQNLPGAPVAKNGSGMGNSNRFTPAQITALLRWAWQQKEWWPEYVSALSIAGADGTVKKRFCDSSCKGIVRAKTGTLADYGVTALAGYILLPKTTYAFAILINKSPKNPADDWKLQEKILEAVMPK
ncbi:MAG: D-alanyl-D-alanine carboxypeptidase/D-alanyl-D-alanine-endopeptidase, partial [Chitinivibrionales bacterium]|nr:D-alanyl-D-alanine carboxypeptidase/D-alanyl-D-alanine-endopeptidase [Chitinivibrionales bacterium]